MPPKNCGRRPLVDSSRRCRPEMAGARARLSKSSAPIRTRCRMRISKPSASSCGTLLLPRFACFEVLRHRFNKAVVGMAEGVARAGCRRNAPSFASVPTRASSNSSNTCSGLPTANWRAAKKLAEEPWHEGWALSRRCRRRAVNGFDAWNEQVAISRHLAVGAPPDPLNTLPARTGVLPASTPAAWRRNPSIHSREMLAASMRHSGAIRLDHVLGLKRPHRAPRGFLPRARAPMVQMPLKRCSRPWRSKASAHKRHRDRRGSRHRTGRLSRDPWPISGIWSYLVVMFERDDARSLPGHRPLLAQRAGHSEHPRSVRPMPAGAPSAI